MRDMCTKSEEALFDDKGKEVSKKNVKKGDARMGNDKRKSRVLHYDWLRIAAAFSVVMLHSAAQFWYTLDIYGRDWIIANSYDAVFRFGVPSFVMISGAIFLDKDYQLDIRRLYRHNILRMLVLYAVWSCVYGLWDCAGFDLKTAGVKAILREMLLGRYHLWFLPMIAGIYVLLPVLKEWISHAKEENIRYFLALFLVIQIGGETLRALTVTDELHYILDLMKIEMVCSYIGYFVWGYYLTHIRISDKLCRLFYVAALPAVVCNVLLGNHLAHRAGEPLGAIYDSYGIFTFIVVTALYLFAVNKVSTYRFGKTSERIVKEIAGNTLGIYVMHIGLMEALERVGIHSMMIPNIWGIPLYALLCFIICGLVAAGLRRIPFIGKYIC